ncbi:MAG: hypothetical protein AB7S92_12000 [Parvibaculaceae bacterium]
MITRRHMFEPLLAALPGFRPAWQAFADHWTDASRDRGAEPGDLPHYLLIADLARHLADLLEAGRQDDVRHALAVAERWLLEGDAYVKEAATVGLIEDLQNVAQRRGIAEDRFTVLLGPEGRHWWDKVSRFWSKGEHLVDERSMSPSARAVWKMGQTFNLARWRARRRDLP